MGQKRFYIPEYNASGMADENMSAETLAAIKKMCKIAYEGLNSTKPPVSGRSEQVCPYCGRLEHCDGAAGYPEGCFHPEYNGQTCH